MSRIRPRCRRCHGKLDLWCDPETGFGLICNNPLLLATDAEFWRRWDALSPEDQTRLAPEMSQETCVFPDNPTE